jgi:hypothetical protein
MCSIPLQILQILSLILDFHQTRGYCHEPIVMPVFDPTIHSFPWQPDDPRQESREDSSYHQIEVFLSELYHKVESLVELICCLRK